MPGGNRWSRAAWIATAGVALGAASCGSDDSALNPKGPGAETAADLWWVMLAVSTAIYVLVLGLLAAGLARRRRAAAAGAAPGGEGAHDTRWIVLGGVALPVVVLMSLLGLTVRTLGAERTEGAVRATVVGHQYWWEIRYPDSGAVTANELHVPVGEPVELTLLSEDVVHSFWVPQLDTKTDMVPGRENRMVIEAREPGVYRGRCAEFCGLQHANMAFLVIAEPHDDFDAWLDGQAAPAAEPDGPAEARGRDLFTSRPCAGCHTIRGVVEEASIGPDLTHLASRRTIAAVTLPNDPEHLAAWVTNAQEAKPGNLMPPLALSQRELRDLVAYLESLE